MSGAIRDSYLRPFSPGSAWMTSTADEELVTGFPPDWNSPSFRTISFTCKTACTVEVVLGMGSKAKTHTLSINPDYGLELDERFDQIYSFKIKDAGIEYYYLASY